MSELLTPEEMRVIYCDAQYASAVDAWEAIAKAQLAKCKEHEKQAVLAKDAEWKEKMLCALEAQSEQNVETLATTFDDFNLTVIPARIAEAKRELIKWLDEPCSEHCLEKRGMTDLRYPFTYFWYAEHRRDCPSCWQAIKELKI